MALDPRQSLPSRAAPPGFAFPPQWIEGLSRGREHQRIVFVYGPPSSGKTSLIKHWLQTQSDLNPAVLEVQSDHLSYAKAVQRLGALVGLSHEEFSFEALGKELAEAKSTLVIDNLDRIENWAVLVDQLKQMHSENRSAAIVVTVSDLSALDPIDLLDFEIVRLNGLTELEIENILHQIQVPIHKKVTAKDVALEILENTNGQPGLVRLYFAYLLALSEPITPNVIEGLKEKVATRFLRLALSSAKISDQNSLIELALLKYSNALKDAALKSLSSTVKFQLVAAGFLQNNLLGGFQITQLFSESIHSVAPELIEAGRLKVLDRLIQPATDAELAEKVYQLTQLSRPQEAAALLEKSAFDSNLNLSELDYVQLTEPLWKYISPRIYLNRSVALTDLSRYREIKAECLFRFETNTQASEKAEWAITLARILNFLGHTDKARELVTQNSLDRSTHFESWAMAQLMCGVSFIFNDPKKALSIVEPIHNETLTRQLPKNSRLAKAARAYTFWILEVMGHFRAARAILVEPQENDPYLSKHSFYIYAGQLEYLKYEMGLLNEMPIVLSQYRFHELISPGHIHVLISHENNMLREIDSGDLAAAVSRFEKNLEPFLIHSPPVANLDIFWYSVILFYLRLNELGLAKQFLAQRFIEWETLGLNLETWPAIQFVQNHIATTGNMWPLEAAQDLEKLYLKIPPLHFLRCFELFAERLWQVGSFTKLEHSLVEALQNTLREIDKALMWHKVVVLFGLTIESDSHPMIDSSQWPMVIKFFDDRQLQFWSLRARMAAQLVDRSCKGQEALHFLKDARYSGDCFEAHWVRRLEYLFNNPDEAQINVIKHSAFQILSHKIILTSPSRTSVMGKVVDVFTHSELSFDEALKRGYKILDLQNRKLISEDKSTSLKDKSTLFKMLDYLFAQGSRWATKEEITTSVWQESYHPLVHDTRIYTSIRRLREMVEIEIQDGCYKLKDAQPLGSISTSS
jgi:GTPase SAR1 family protein